jgi:hypothetical protein
LTTHSSSPWPPEARRRVAAVRKWSEPRRSKPPGRITGGPHRNPNLGELLLSLSSPTVRS